MQKPSKLLKQAHSKQFGKRYKHSKFILSQFGTLAVE